MTQNPLSREDNAGKAQSSVFHGFKSRGSTHGRKKQKGQDNERTGKAKGKKTNETTMNSVVFKTQATQQAFFVFVLERKNRFFFFGSVVSDL